MANLIKPYNNDSSVGHLSTPITNSLPTKAFLGNLPAYRLGLSPLLRGLEIGMAHGYFLIGPFEKLGPLRNSPLALLVGFLATIGLIIILTIGLIIYGNVTFQKKSDFYERFSNKDLQTFEGWSKFYSGFFIGAIGGASVAYLILLNFFN
jgi:photosystem I subunit XI